MPLHVLFLREVVESCELTLQFAKNENFDCYFEIYKCVCK